MTETNIEDIPRDEAAWQNGDHPPPALQDVEPARLAETSPAIIDGYVV